MSEHRGEPLQNDPDRAGGLVPDTVGEFVAEEPGGAFDPRAFREPRQPSAGVPGETTEPGPDAPPVDDERMVGPGEEIGKVR